MLPSLLPGWTRGPSHRGLLEALSRGQSQSGLSPLVRRLSFAIDVCPRASELCPGKGFVPSIFVRPALLTPAARPITSDQPGDLVCRLIPG
jgi:hypothetical protein